MRESRGSGTPRPVIRSLVKSRAGRGTRWAAVSLLITGVVLALAGCVASGPSSSDPRLVGTWHLASGSDDGRAIPIGGQSVTLTIGDAAHTGGGEPCSSYRATVTGGIGVVYIRALLTGGTRDECTTATLTKLEQLYITALGATRFAAINQGALELSSPSSDLVFVRSAPSPATNLENTTWRLYAILTPVPMITEGKHIAPIELSFFGSNQLILHSPCLNSSASYQIRGASFVVTDVGNSPVPGNGCASADRNLANQALTMFEGPLLVNESTDGAGNPDVLVITDVDDNLPIVWRSGN